MNCPSCSAPLLFGSTACGCGYRLGSDGARELPIELSYWEALRVFWRVYWPQQALVGLIVALVGKTSASALLQLVAQALLSGGSFPAVLQRFACRKDSPSALNMGVDRRALLPDLLTRWARSQQLLSRRRRCPTVPNSVGGGAPVICSCCRSSNVNGSADETRPGIHGPGVAH